MTPELIISLVSRGALFVVNHSGGKDSQAMMIRLLKFVPPSQMVVIHATLGEVEWEGALELAQKQAADAGVDFIVARAYWKDESDKTFLNMAERRFERRPEVPSFPGASENRQCTSDLKRGPIERETRRYMAAKGFTLVVDCEGIRAAESTARRKRNPLVYLNDELNKDGKPKSGLAQAGRQAWKWLPIFDMETLDVWCTIRGAGQMPHYAYSAGNERLSCVFCIMGSKGDIYNGAKARPELFAKYVALEARTGYAMHASRRTLTEIVAEVEAELALPQAA